MTDREKDGDPDDARRSGSTAGEAGADAEGSTRVIGTSHLLAGDTPGADRTTPVSGPGAAPWAPAVHVPPQGGPPRAEGSPAAGPATRPAAEPADRWGPPTAAAPGSGYGPPAPWAPAPHNAPGAPGSGYGQPAERAGPWSPGQPAASWAPPPPGAGGGYGPAGGVAANPWGPPPGAGYGSPGGPPTTAYPSGYGGPDAAGYAPAYAGVGYAPGYGAAPPGAPGGYPGAPAGPPGAPPPPGYTPTPPARRRGLTALVALVAVVALAAGGVVAYLYLRGGGGDTPAEAVRLLADDLQSGDLTRAATRVHPDEVALGVDLGEMISDEMVRLEVLRPDADTASLNGTTFENLTFDEAAVEQVRPDVAITKLVGGTIRLNRDVNALPLTDSYKARAYPNGVPADPGPEVIDIARVVAEQGRPVRVATVQVDGDWYASATYTLADYALVEEGQAWPQGTVAPRGAATAQDALRESISAVFAQDARRLIELAPPRELAVLHDVGPLLVENAGTPQSTGRLVDLAATESPVPGGTALTIDRIVAEDDRGSRVTIVRDGDCVSVTETRSYASSPTRLCAEDVARDGFGSSPYLDPALRDIMVKSARAALGLRVVVVEDGGQYYVSPVRTAVGLGIDVLKMLEPADLARLSELGAR